MNVFYTNKCPIKSALEHNTIHTRKMIVEYSQLLATAHFELDGNVVGYKPTHKNHPSAIWVRQDKSHYEWVYSCAKELCKQYTTATGKVHATEKVLEKLSLAPNTIRSVKFKEPPVAAPDEFKAMAVFEGSAPAYQKYLLSKYKEWQQRDKPLKVEWYDSKPRWVSGL